MCNGEEKEFKASTLVKKITSGRYRGYKIVPHALPFSALPANTKLELGELYYLMPPLMKKPFSSKDCFKLANQTTRTKQKAKIVLTRQQLELLLRNVEFMSKGIAVRFSGSFREGYGKWQPSLAAIQEGKDLNTL
ncbi:hypothetical protein GH714_016305 [Hevea brasiliensis]|uniref:Uncharacterized protein n=1 Tax=Hevea brasiliensis TaxID=3981 RepID=A0A6A6KIR5_HEVBR|nr:hypothetical protein GH714_016305 [Hevea brasiliensis]